MRNIGPNFAIIEMLFVFAIKAALMKNFCTCQIVSAGMFDQI